MYYHEKAKLIYLSSPRTASVATSLALREQAGFRAVPGAGHHTKLWGMLPERIVTEANRKEWTVFTTVRNHWDAAVSWVFKDKDPAIEIDWTDVETFRRALDNGFVTEHEMWSYHLDDCDDIVYYEQLRDNLESLLSKHGVDLPHSGLIIPFKNESKKRLSYCGDYYSFQTWRYIASRFAFEMQILGYKQEDVLLVRKPWTR